MLNKTVIVIMAAALMLGAAGNAKAGQYDLSDDKGGALFGPLPGQFQVIILVRAVISGWSDIFEVGTEFQTFQLCEVARPELADDFKQFMEGRHSEPFRVQSKCVNLHDQI